MGWPEVRAHIASVLADIEISAPLPERIEYVYQHPEKTVTAMPCFVILPSQYIDVEVLSGWRTETREVACLFMATDGQDWALASESAEAFREAAIAAFDSHNGLGGYGSLLGRRAEGFDSRKFGGRDVIWFELLLTVRYETGADQS